MSDRQKRMVLDVPATAENALLIEILRWHVNVESVEIYYKTKSEFSSTSAVKMVKLTARVSEETAVNIMSIIDSAHHHG